MFKKITSALAAIMIMTVPALASAHVVVKPATAGVGEFLTFTVGVPNEKDVDVTALKLDIPDGLNYVTPTVKPGWTITTDKTGTGESAVVKSISWTGGTIGAGLRDDFTFAAQVPAKAGDIHWKAYQTYADGTTVSWDQTPTKNETESADAGPYSITSVKNDLTSAGSTTQASGNSPVAITALVVGLVALLGVIGTALFRKK